jgi:hypothetical protein
MPRLNKEHATKRVVAYEMATRPLRVVINRYDFGEGGDRALALEAQFLLTKIEKEKDKFIKKHGL